MQLVTALVLRSFGYAADGHNVVRLHAGEVKAIRADAIAGLVAEGFIEADDSPADPAPVSPPGAPAAAASPGAAPAPSGTTIAGDPPIPASWETEKWFLRRSLATKISGTPVTDSDVANSIIRAEVEKRQKA